MNLVFGWGEFFSISCALGWAFAVILFRKSGETLPAFELNLIKNTIGVALMLPTAILLGGALPDYGLNGWFLVVGSGVLGIAVADYWYLRALNLLGAGRTGISASLYAPFVILLSMVFLGESLGAYQWLGFVFVLGGILLVSWHKHQTEVTAQDLKKGVAFAVGAVFMMALGVIMVKEILETEDFYWTVYWRLAAGLGGLLIFTSLRRGWPKVLKNIRKPQPWLLIAGGSFLGSYLSMMLWLAGYKLTDATTAAMLNETAGAFIVVLAWWFLKEPLSKQKLMGLCFTAIGVLFVLNG
ncbi:MAG: DMT family transporter [Xanthomonadales bacterium]|nr:DMT family transporter [Xanthomonadales bacterium]